ncbi:hypothetical protein Y1Q_0002840 [Alligator mississippiensis]|uniref:Uncharacterized protein n=1 Tax=Alligator mississippiensis TaxID=8496 RepID=A0A151NZA6_ALLMI|nr:hypothetical protein Y1Q_0002840 [Alligator mississippiensis]
MHRARCGEPGSRRRRDLDRREAEAAPAHLAPDRAAWRGPAAAASTQTKRTHWLYCLAVETPFHPHWRPFMQKGPAQRIVQTPFMTDSSGAQNDTRGSGY